MHPRWPIFAQPASKCSDERVSCIRVPPTSLCTYQTRLTSAARGSQGVIKVGRGERTREFRRRPRSFEVNALTKVSKVSPLGGLHRPSVRERLPRFVENSPQDLSTPDRNGKSFREQAPGAKLRKFLCFSLRRI